MINYAVRILKYLGFPKRKEPPSLAGDLASEIDRIVNNPTPEDKMNSGRNPYVLDPEPLPRTLERRAYDVAGRLRNRNEIASAISNIARDYAERMVLRTSQIVETENVVDVYEQIITLMNRIKLGEEP